MKITGSVIMVTGASQGIGLETALLLTRMGATVLFAARSIDKLNQIVVKAGANACAIQMDVTDSRSVDAAFVEIMKRFGRIDAVINNAGLNGTLASWIDMKPREMHDMFDVHVFGTERVIRAVMPIMKQQGSGLIVNIASIVAWVPMPGSAAYSAAKAAVVSLSETLREELREYGVDVRHFTPAHTNTGFPIDRKSTDTPESVANALVVSLQGDKAMTVMEGKLILLKRIFPKMTAKIMTKLGLRSLALFKMRDS